MTFNYSTKIAGVTDNMRLVVTISMENGVSMQDATIQTELVSELRVLVLDYLRKLGIPADLEE